MRKHGYNKADLDGYTVERLATEFEAEVADVGRPETTLRWLLWACDELGAYEHLHEHAMDLFGYAESLIEIANTIVDTAAELAAKAGD